MSKPGTERGQRRAPPRRPRPAARDSGRSSARAAKPSPARPLRDGSTDPLALLERARAAGGLEVPGLSIRLARAFGFCQGVKRAVELAFAAADLPPQPEAASSAVRTAARSRGAAPPGAGEPRLFVTGEIIHNPAINAGLRAAGITPLPVSRRSGRLSGVRPEDQVIIPAFGIEVAEERVLREIGCQLTDTTCGWVRRVWKAAAEFSAAGLTIVIHGRADHEETRATASRVRGPWLIVRDAAEAEVLAEAVRLRDQSGWRRFRGSRSPAFDRERDLERLGLVNQTTMLDRETQQIGRILRAALTERHGAAPDSGTFRALATFCTATQRRQDAVRTLLATGDLQRLIVVGGFRSSNTAHLARLGGERVRTYHVEDADCLVSRTWIRHLVPGAEQPARTRGWFPEAPRVIGVTAGASTPDTETGRILARLLELHHQADGGRPRPPRGSGRVRGGGR